VHNRIVPLKEDSGTRGNVHTIQPAYSWPFLHVPSQQGGSANRTPADNTMAYTTRQQRHSTHNLKLRCHFYRPISLPLISLPSQVSHDA
jgi:hypothetical protein